METEPAQGRLQIYSVEERGAAYATCIVRCVGGIARTGQRFNAAADSPGEEVSITLDKIIRYGRTVDFIDPPHNAKVEFSGPGVIVLTRGVIAVSEDH